MKKVAVITGSTRGIGFGMAREFLRRGHDVVVSGRSNAAVEQAVAKLQPLATGGASVWGQVCEVSEPAQVQKLWEGAVARFGRVDVWVNNAGLCPPGRKPLHRHSVEAMTTVVSTNVTGLMACCQVAIQGMLAQGGGQVWNMEGFGSDDMMAPGMSVYGTTKRAVTYLTRALQKELEGTPVQVCSLLPGIVLTDMILGEGVEDPGEQVRSRKLYNVLADREETVTPFLVEGILQTKRSGARVSWLTPGKAMLRFLTAPFIKRNPFSGPTAS
jgi:NAD(P)-dependent dehydrogenase (short-subunit alcohol dehydrogenase family)